MGDLSLGFKRREAGAAGARLDGGRRRMFKEEVRARDAISKGDGRFNRIQKFEIEGSEVQVRYECEGWNGIYESRLEGRRTFWVFELRKLRL